MLAEGKKAPAFTLPNQDGEKIKLSQFKGQRLVLFFYPKDMTSGCTTEVIDFQAALSKFKRKKVAVVSISKESVKSKRKFADKHDLTFTLLADEDTAICEKYGVMKEKSMYGKKFMGIERTTFIIGEDGKIEKIFPKVKVKGHVDDVLASL